MQKCGALFAARLRIRPFRFGRFGFHFWFEQVIHPCHRVLQHDTIGNVVVRIAVVADEIVAAACDRSLLSADLAVRAGVPARASQRPARDAGAYSSPVATGWRLPAS